MPDPVRILRRLLRLARLTLIGIAVSMTLLVLLVYFVAVRMPGDSLQGPLPEASIEEKTLAVELERDVRHLAEQIGPRALAKDPAKLAEAADYIEEELKKSGPWDIRRETYQAAGESVSNIIAERRGLSRPERWILIGGHYDSVHATPGADDNASAVAGLLAFARRLGKTPLARSLRLVAFVNEEPPFFQSDEMGSLVHARGCRERNESIDAVVVLEMLGCFSDAPGSQHYPPPFSFFYPDTGNFIAFVGDLNSRALVHRLVSGFRAQGRLPSDGLASPDLVPGIGFSDHWSFWQVGYPAVMVTDTAFFRYAHYHQPSDTPDKLDYDAMARVVSGLLPVINDMLSESEQE